MEAYSWIIALLVGVLCISAFVTTYRNKDTFGPVGARGYDGPSGPVGPYGATGPQGPQGPPGLLGAQGPTGLRGPPGDNGQQGTTGPSGVTGPSGAAGPPGTPGTDGANGTLLAFSQLTPTVQMVWVNGPAPVLLRTPNLEDGPTGPYTSVRPADFNTRACVDTGRITLIGGLGGGSALYYSFNGGASWYTSATATSIFVDGIRALAWNGVTFVALGLYGSTWILASSTDGITWTSLPGFSLPPGNIITQIIDGRQCLKHFVVNGTSTWYIWSFNAGVTTVQTSTDLVTWTATTLTSLPLQDVSDQIRVGQYWIVSGYHAAANSPLIYYTNDATLTNATTWSPIANTYGTGPFNRITKLVHNGTHIVAGGLGDGSIGGFSRLESDFLASPSGDWTIMNVPSNPLSISTLHICGAAFSGTRWYITTMNSAQTTALLYVSSALDATGFVYVATLFAGSTIGELGPTDPQVMTTNIWGCINGVGRPTTYDQMLQRVTAAVSAIVQYSPSGLGTLLL